MNKKVINFKEPVSWALNGALIKINRLETVVYQWKLDTECEEDEVLPSVSTVNVIKNVAKLPNAAFLEYADKKVAATISDLVGSTLIRTVFVYPETVFNSVVGDLTINCGMPEELFYVTSRFN